VPLALYRGVAERDASGELKLVLSDFPFAEDGLLLWNAFESYFTEYLNMFYSDDGRDGKSKVCWP
jgi:lipoxygenase